jgi:Heterokaryon incompatibility protein (HET)
MWIDAICVNQKNKVERSSQVLYMGRIFSIARDVIIWLGESSELSDELFLNMDITLGVGKRALATVRGSQGMLGEDILTPFERTVQAIQDGVWSFQDNTMAYLIGAFRNRLLKAREDSVDRHKEARLAHKKAYCRSEVIP